MGTLEATDAKGRTNHLSKKDLSSGRSFLFAAALPFDFLGGSDPWASV